MKTQHESDDYVPAHHTLENQIAELVNKLDSLFPNEDRYDTYWLINVYRDKQEKRDTYMLSFFEPGDLVPHYVESFHELLGAQLELRRQLQLSIDKHQNTAA